MPNTRMSGRRTGNIREWNLKLSPEDVDDQARRLTTSPSREEDEDTRARIDEQRLSIVLSMVGDRLLRAADLVNSERDARRLADRIAAVLPKEPVAEAIGPVLETSDLMEWRGVTKQAVHNQRQRGDILAMKTTDGHWVYPDWQFTRHGNVLPGVAESVQALTQAGMDSWTQAIWFRGETSELEGHSAADWLTAGREPSAVVRQAGRTAARWSQ